MWTRQTAPLDGIVKHIVGTHHEYLKLELPGIGNRMDRVLAVHGPKDQQTISRLADVSGSLRAEMEMHIAALNILASLCPHDLAPLAIQRRQ
jgi:regulator of cell morphogenesis and NO signaling